VLLELQVQDFTLIEKLKLSFNKGLNILTGETGAGKSIIIDSVNFVLGERTSKDVIRTGADSTSVEAVFENIDNPELINLLKDYGINPDDEVLILFRELSISGRSICRVNGRTVTTSILKSIGNYLIDIHGQHEHQSLLDEEKHIDILDTFGGIKLLELKKLVFESYEKVQDLKRRLKSMMGDDRERERRIGLLKFQIDEIDSTKLKKGEEEELLKQRLILGNANKLFSVLSDTYGALYESTDISQAVFDRLGSVINEFRSIVNIDEKLQNIFKAMEDSYYNLEGVIDDIRDYRDKIDFNPQLIDDVESRIDTINKLKRKYGSTIDEIINYREDIENELNLILNSEEVINNLKKQLSIEEGILQQRCRELSDLRKEISKRLEKDIVNELKFLGMDKSTFTVSLELNENNGVTNYSNNGMDKVQFLISTNPGEPEKPLSKIASGGEISRIMLAIKTVLANLDKIPSLIFDEIDTGISGKAAQAVAEKLGQISSTHQVICVTHLPQIASMADTHFYISKSSADGKTTTSVDGLDHGGRINEVARMLGGVKLTDLTLKHAEEMIELAQGIKALKR
jgi:DNA repair protein RecN